MNLLNATGMAAGYTLGMDKAGYEHVVVVVKGTFTLPKPGETPKLADEQVPLVDADLFTGEPGLSATLVECDYAPEKARCDVLLNGAAHAPNGRPVERVAVGLQVGAWRKSFAVWGNREWRRAGIGYAPSAPEPVPAHADLLRQRIRRHGRWHARSGAARNVPAESGRAGWHKHIYPELVVGTPVSNTEEIRDPVRDPGGTYQPMALGPIGRGWPSRLRHAGTYDQDWIDSVFPFLPRDFDTRYYQCAPEDQQVPHLRGGEQVLLVNLTPDGRREFVLPMVDMPIVFFLRRAERVETSGRLDTVLFEPTAERFTLVLRASLKLRRDIFEVSQVAVGRMSRAWWRSIRTGKSYKSLDAIVREKAANRERA